MAEKPDYEHPYGQIPTRPTVSMKIVAVKEMTFVAFLKSDIAGKDVMGWKQHQKVLKEDGFDV